MSSETDLSRNQAIQNQRNSFSRGFRCHSTWKRCKHSGHFSRFRNIIGNFCIIKQKCLCNYVINIDISFRKFKIKQTLQIKLKKSIFDHCSILLYNQEQSIPHGQVQISVKVRGCLVLFHGRHPPSSRTWTPNHRPSVLPLPHNGMDSALR
jgi:hypothetical protein